LNTALFSLSRCVKEESKAQERFICEIAHIIFFLEQSLGQGMEDELKERAKEYREKMEVLKTWFERKNDLAGGAFLFLSSFLTVSRLVRKVG